jgi:hypothetical protein
MGSHRDVATAGDVMRALLVAAIVLAAPGDAVAGVHCDERSAIVGRKRCSGFGHSWAHGWKDELEISFMGSALVVEHVALPAVDTSGAAYNSTGSANYRLTAGRQRMWAVGVRTGVRWHGPHAIAGFEIAGAMPVESPSVVTTLENYGPIAGADVFLFEPALYGGAHWRLDQLDLSAVAVAGARELSFSPRMPYGLTTCPGGGQGKGCSVFATETYPFAGVRSGVDLWLTRYLTLGISAGVDLTDRSESFALELHFHFAPYDGS